MNEGPTMIVMPSQVVNTIDELFPNAKNDTYRESLFKKHSSKLLGILNLLNIIPDDLININSSDRADLVLATSAIQVSFDRWREVGGDAIPVSEVNNNNVVKIIRNILVKCPDEHLPQSTTELVFILDGDLRDSIRRDIAAADRAFSNAEWKAATVLAGAAIEALLHWRLGQPLSEKYNVNSVIGELVEKNKIRKGFALANIDSWGLYELIKVASKVGLITQGTETAAMLAKDFRNLIHPGRAIRLAQTCDRSTAHFAIGALDAVARDLRQQPADDAAPR